MGLKKPGSWRGSSIAPDFSPGFRKPDIPGALARNKGIKTVLANKFLIFLMKCFLLMMILLIFNIFSDPV